MTHRSTSPLRTRVRRIDARSISSTASVTHGHATQVHVIHVVSACSRAPSSHTPAKHAASGGIGRPATPPTPPPPLPPPRRPPPPPPARNTPTTDTPARRAPPPYPSPAAPPPARAWQPRSPHPSHSCRLDPPGMFRFAKTLVILHYDD